MPYHRIFAPDTRHKNVSLVADVGLDVTSCMSCFYKTGTQNVCQLACCGLYHYVITLNIKTGEIKLDLPIYAK